MPKEKLRIALSANRLPGDPTRDLYRGKELEYLEAELVQRVVDMGALPVMVPNRVTPALRREFARACDGLMLSGGADVAPESYGEKPIGKRWPGDRRRDIAELGLIAEFRKAGKPILGLCRGVQILNVAYGGTLYQDLPTQFPTKIVHRNPDVYDRNKHKVDLAAGSVLSKLAGGKKRITVNSVHHQAIKDVGRGLEVLAVSEDGVTEAVRDPKRKFVLGVQWHPEWTKVRTELPLPALFGTFLESCGKH